jgi:hypothetical protein
MIDFNDSVSYDQPYNYLSIENVFDKKTLEKLLEEFPDVSDTKSVMGGRRKLESRDADNWLNNSPTWKSFYDFINQQENLDLILNNYKKELNYWKSNINSTTSMKDDCFVHIDWSMAEDGYIREVHCDSDPRFWNFIIFLNDKNWTGGDFIMHSSEKVSYFKKHFWKRKLPIEKVFEAKKNFGIFFLSTPNSYHSVSFQKDTIEKRKFIYGSISYKGKTFNRSYRKKPNYVNLILDHIDEFPHMIKRIGRKIKRK